MLPRHVNYVAGLFLHAGQFSKLNGIVSALSRSYNNKKCACLVSEKIQGQGRRALRKLLWWSKGGGKVAWCLQEQNQEEEEDEGEREVGEPNYVHRNTRSTGHRS